MNKYYLIFFRIPFILALIGVFYFFGPKTYSEIYKEEITELLANDYNWLITEKYLDKNDHYLQKIVHQSISDTGKKSEKSCMDYTMYNEIYDFIEVGDTLVKHKGSLYFQIRNGSKNGFFTIPEKDTIPIR